MFEIHYTDCPEPPIDPPDPPEDDGGCWRYGEWIEPSRAGEEW